LDWNLADPGAILQRYQRAAAYAETAREFLAAWPLFVKTPGFAAEIAFAAVCFIALISFQNFTERYDIKQQSRAVGGVGYYAYLPTS